MAYEYKYDREEKSLGCCTQMGRYFLMLVNILFIVASIVGIVAGILLLEGKDDGYLKFCEPCKQFNTFMIIVFASLFVFSFTGFCALWKRNSCLLVVYGFFLVIFFLAAACITIVIFMIHDGRFDKRLQNSWEKEVADNSDDSMCKFQYDFKCTGWDVMCPFSNATFNYTSYDNYTQAEQKNCPDCFGTQYYAQLDNPAVTDKTCHTVLRNDVDQYYYILLGAGFGLMFLALLSIVISCKVRVEYEQYDELNERL